MCSDVKVYLTSWLNFCLKIPANFFFGYHEQQKLTIKNIFDILVTGETDSPATNG